MTHSRYGSPDDLRVNVAWTLARPLESTLGTWCHRGGGPHAVAAYGCEPPRSSVCRRSSARSILHWLSFDDPAHATLRNRRADYRDLGLRSHAAQQRRLIRVARHSVATSVKSDRDAACAPCTCYVHWLGPLALAVAPAARAFTATPGAEAGITRGCWGNRRSQPSAAHTGSSLHTRRISGRCESPSQRGRVHSPERLPTRMAAHISGAVVERRRIALSVPLAPVAHDV